MSDVIDTRQNLHECQQCRTLVSQPQHHHFCGITGAAMPQNTTGGLA